MASSRPRWSSSGPRLGDRAPPSVYWRIFHSGIRVVRIAALGSGLMATGYALGQQEVIEDVTAFELSTTVKVLVSTSADRFLPIKMSQEPARRARGLGCAAYQYRLDESSELQLERLAAETPLWRASVQAHRVFGRVRAAARAHVQDRIRELLQKKAAAKGSKRGWSEKEAEELRHWTSTVSNLEMEWRVIGIAGEAPNAFVVGILPRRIFVTSGLAQHFAHNDEQMALVLAHELSHYLLRHTAERASADAVIKIIVMSCLSLFDPSGGTFSLAFEYFLPLIGQLFSLSLSRSAETEADSLGLELCALAGYKPETAVRLFDNMAAFTALGKLAPENAQGFETSFMSTHPLSEERQRNATRLMPAMMEIYERSDPDEVLKRDGAPPTSWGITSAW